MLLHMTGFCSFLRLNNILLVQTSLYLLMDGYLGCFYVLTVVTSAATLNMGVHVVQLPIQVSAFRRAEISSSFSCIIRSQKLLDHFISLCLIF